MPFARQVATFALVVPTALAGWACSSARFGDAEGEGTVADAGGDPGGGTPDAGGIGVPTPDAAPQTPTPIAVTLSQSTSDDIVGGTAVACFEAVNSYYRVFPLVQAGVEGDLQVSGVTFGVEEALSGAGGLPATVLLHKLEGTLGPDGAFQLSSLELVNTVDTTISDVAFPGEGEIGGDRHTVSITGTIPAGGTLVVEVTHPAYDEGQSLLMGSNTAGETGFTYLRAPACDTNQPTKASDIVDEDTGDNVTMHWVLEVIGKDTVE
jgi:hypothetical protein